MSWEPEIDEIRRRIEIAKGMGGPENVKRQHDGGKLTVRERIERLLDAGSFHEYGAIAGSPKYEGDKLVDFRPANFVGGTGRINGRRVAVGGDDFTVRGGAADASIGNKQSYFEMLAPEVRVPIIRLVDGTGGGGSVRTFETTARTYVPANPAFDVLVKVMAEVPVVAGCMGSVAGIGAARVAASHFSVMVRGTSQLFVAGPPVVKWGTGEELTKEELGGSEIHAHISGAVDNEVENEDEAFAHIPRYLSSFLLFTKRVVASPAVCEPGGAARPPRGGAHQHHPAYPAPGLRPPPHARFDPRSRFVLRDGAVLRPLADHRLRAHRRLS